MNGVAVGCKPLILGFLQRKGQRVQWPPASGRSFQGPCRHIFLLRLGAHLPVGSL